jgi:hypothetical protein
VTRGFGARVEFAEKSHFGRKVSPQAHPTVPAPQNEPVFTTKVDARGLPPFGQTPVEP